MTALAGEFLNYITFIKAGKMLKPNEHCCGQIMFCNYLGCLCDLVVVNE